MHGVAGDELFGRFAFYPARGFADLIKRETI